MQLKFGKDRFLEIEKRIDGICRAINLTQKYECNIIKHIDNVM